MLNNCEALNFSLSKYWYNINNMCVVKINNLYEINCGDIAHARINTL